jgi:hypothetical protein
MLSFFDYAATPLLITLILIIFASHAIEPLILPLLPLIAIDIDLIIIIDIDY